MEFKELLEEYGIPYQTEGRYSRPNWLQLACPWCDTGQGKFGLGYNLEHRYCHCWKCGSKPLIKVIQALTGESITKCYELKGGLDFQRATRMPRLGRLILPSGLESLGKAHFRYLEARGFDPEGVGSLWGLRGLGAAAGRLKWRIWIPVVFNGQTISWTARSVADTVTPRYIAARADQEAYPAKRVLYGHDLTGQTLLIVEGPLDVWTVGPGAVATLGTGYSRGQLRQMVKHPKRYVCFDSETGAQQVAQRLVAELSGFPGQTFNIVLDSGKDPSRVSAREVKQLRRLLK